MEAYTLDQTDLKLLNLLQQDGLMTYKQLCTAIHKSYHPVVERVNRLYRLGYIKKTVALVDIHKIKSVFTAFPMIQLKNHHEDTFRQFAEIVAAHPEVMECNHIMGHYDFMLKVVVADAPAYNEFLRKNISTLDIVQRIESFPVLAQVKEESTYRL